MELGAKFAPALDALGPAYSHADLGAAVVRCDLLGPLIGGVKRHRPAGRHVRVCLRTAPFIHDLKHVLNLFLNPIEVGHFAEHAAAAAFGAGAIVTVHKDNQCIFELPRLLNGFHDTADFIISHLHKGGKDLGLMCKKSLFIRRKRVPIRNRLRLWRQLCALRHDTAFNLPGQNFLAQFVPPLVKFSFPASDPLGRHMVRGMNGTGGVINKKRLNRGQCLLVFDPGDCLVGHVGQEVIVRIIRQFDLMGAVVDKGCPLVGFAAQKPVKLIKSLAGRPSVKRPGHTRLPGGGFVPFAESGGRIPVKTQRLGYRRNLAGYLAGVAGKGRSRLNNAPNIANMMVASALDRCSCRRRDGGGVEVIVIQSLFCQAVKSRG